LAAGRTYRRNEQDVLNVTQSSKSQEIVSARRRLLRGSFAAPAVLALHSGSAIAATTSALRCIANQVASPTTQAVVTSNDGAWLRVQLWAYVKSGKAYNGEYWLRGSDLSAYVVNAQMPFLSSTQFQKFNIDTNVLVGAALSTQPVAPDDKHVWQAVSRFVSLRVTATGAIVSAGASTVSSASSAVSGTCWNSFKLGA
jgi:hypothetical protein